MATDSMYRYARLLQYVIKPRCTQWGVVGRDWLIFLDKTDGVDKDITASGYVSSVPCHVRVLWSNLATISPYSDSYLQPYLASSKQRSFVTAEKVE